MAQPEHPHPNVKLLFVSFFRFYLYNLSDSGSHFDSKSSTILDLLLLMLPFLIDPPNTLSLSADQINSSSYPVHLCLRVPAGVRAGLFVQYGDNL